MKQYLYLMLTIFFAAWVSKCWHQFMPLISLQFMLNPVARTTFVLIGISNILGKFFTGFFLDRYEEAPVICSMVGNALMLLPFLSLATLPYWHIEDYYRQWVVLGGCPLLSCGFAMIYIATFLRMYKIKLEHVDGQDTSTLIAG